MLVEDEESVRALMRGLLEQGGYPVLEADNGGRTIEIARQHLGPIHLLLTDVAMPGMNGPTLATKISTTRPETRTLFVSGYSGSIGTQTSFVFTESILLQKAFTRSVLLQKLREVLDAPKELQQTAVVAHGESE